MKINKIYQINLSSLSPLTKIPDAQVIFGTFCHTYKIKYGEEALNKFIDNEISNHNILFSSLYFENMLPLPLDFKPERMEYKDSSQASVFKKVKKIRFISKELFIELRNNKDTFLKNFYQNIINGKYTISNGCLVNKGKEFELKEVMRVRNKSGAINKDDANLFYTNAIYPEKNLKFTFYVRLLDDEFEEKVIETIKEFKYISLGGNKSLGYNMFDFDSINEVKELSFAKPQLLISKGVCQKELNFDEANYKVDIINNKFNQSNETVYRKGVITLLEGSIVNNCEYSLGEIIEEKTNNERTCQYMLGLLI